MRRREDTTMKCEWCGRDGGRKSHWSTKWETGKIKQYIMCEECETELDEAASDLKHKKRTTE